MKDRIKIIPGQSVHLHAVQPESLDLELESPKDFTCEQTSGDSYGRSVTLLSFVRKAPQHVINRNQNENDWREKMRRQLLLMSGYRY
jgi:hypothetical protein